MTYIQSVHKNLAELVREYYDSRDSNNLRVQKAMSIYTHYESRIQLRYSKSERFIRNFEYDIVSSEATELTKRWMRIYCRNYEKK